MSTTEEFDKSMEKVCDIPPEEVKIWHREDRVRKARGEVHLWAEDVRTLRAELAFAQAGEPVQAAFDLARARLATACREYADALGEAAK